MNINESTDNINESNIDEPPRYNPINDLRGLLEDTYHSGFPIIKELMQNANDAGASALQISYLERLEGADHPLLKQPLIAVFNDGRYKQEDRDNIRRMRGAGKEDEKAIGKYGLGMKSVLHLCDMFFVIAKGDVDDVLAWNPWMETGIHADWRSTENDIQCLRSLLGDRKGMLLLIPVRNEIKSVEDHIIANKVELKSAFGDWDEMLKYIPDILPLLSIAPNGGTLKRIECDLEGKKIIETHRNIGGNSSEIFISESANIQWKTAVIKSAAHFPKKLAVEIADIKERLPKSEQKRETSTETAICITRKIDQENKGSFRLNFAIFLPLGQDCQFENTAKELTAHYSILLHGMFSCDSGRNRISNFDDIFKVDYETKKKGIKTENASDAKQYWNIFLAQYSVFPLMPIALDQAVKAQVIKQEDIESIVQNINAKLPPKYTAVKKGYSRIYQDNGIAWELFDADRDYIKLPLRAGGGHPFGWFFKPELVSELKKEDIDLILFETAYIAKKEKDKTADFLPLLLKYTNDIFSDLDKQKYCKSFLESVHRKITADEFRDIALSPNFKNEDHLPLFEMLFACERFAETDDKKLKKDIVSKSEKVSLIKVREIDNEKRINICMNQAEIRQYSQDKKVFEIPEDGGITNYRLDFYQHITHSGKIFSISNEESSLFDIKNICGSKAKDILALIQDKTIVLDLSEIYKKKNYKNALISLLKEIDEKCKAVFYKFPIHKVYRAEGFISLDPAKEQYKYSGKENLFPNDFTPSKDIQYVITNGYSEIDGNSEEDDIKTEIDKKGKLFFKELDNRIIIKHFWKGNIKLSSDEQFNWLLKKLETLNEGELNSLKLLLKEKIWVKVKTKNENDFVSPNCIFCKEAIAPDLMQEINAICASNCYSEKDISEGVDTIKRYIKEDSKDFFENTFYKLPIHKVKGKEGYVSLNPEKCYKFSGEETNLFPQDFEPPRDIQFVVKNNYDEIDKKEKEKKLIRPFTNRKVIELYLAQTQSITGNDHFRWLLEKALYEKNDKKYILDLLRGKTFAFDLREICQDDTCKNALFSLLKEIDESYKDIFYKLPIHKVYRAEGFVSLNKSLYKYSDQKNIFPEDFALPEDTQYIVKNEYPAIETLEKVLIKELYDSEIIKQYLERTPKLDTEEQFQWLLKKLKKISDEHRNSLKSLLENRAWVYLKDKKFVSPKDIFSNQSVDPELLQKIKSIPEFQSIRIYSENDIAEETETITGYIQKHYEDFLKRLVAEQAVKDNFFLDCLSDKETEPQK